MWGRRRLEIRLGGVLFAAGLIWLGGALAAHAKPPARGKGRATTPTPAPSVAPSVSPAVTPAPTPDAEAGTPGGELPSANAAPAPSPNPAFIQAYEAAYVQFLQEKYDEARELLDKADAIQPGQSASTSLRGQMFKHFYSEGYLQYASKNYDAAVKQLDAADKILSNQADSFNMRGLIFSRQKDYQNAETMFKKAITLDSTFWEAKFNQAELPFIRSNYTEARARFENLLAQTDQAKQPKETELTEFKVFLTLLLEGKEPAARSLMERFNFTGATPARYYCQAALDFYHGEQEKALGWISSARKEYPAKLEGIFAQAFYRVGWFSDAVAAAAAKSTPVPDAVAAGTGAPVTNSTPMATPAFATGTPASTPGASATPAIVAMNSPAKESNLATPAPAASASAALSAAATTASPAASVAVAGTSPTATIKPVPSPAASASAVTPAPTVVASASPKVPVFPPPIVVEVPTASATASPVAEASSTPVPENAAASSTAEEPGLSTGDYVVLGLAALAMLQTMVTVAVVGMALKRRKERLTKKPLRYSGQSSAKSREAEVSK